MTTNKLLKTFMTLVIAFSTFITPAMAQEKLFYRGDMDDMKAKAPNGAIVNKAYKGFLTTGAFAKPQAIKVRDGVWSVVGYNLSNFTFVEGKTGLIAFDSGNNVGQAQEALKMIRKFIDKPVVATILSHHHYTAGTSAYAETNGGAMDVYGHPDLDKNLQASAGLLGPMQARRAGIQLGFYLPEEGPDASYSLPEPHFDDPALNTIGHMPVTHPVKDGEEVIIDGQKVVFYHIVADTRDSIIAYFPDLDLALHNSGVINFLMSLYTLRGDYYRTPADVIGGIDKLRSINPQYSVGCHGMPITTKEQLIEVATAHRDAYAFVYNQSIRAINRGMTPDEMAATIRLPKHLAEYPLLYPAYVDNEYNVRGQYRGIVGWYAEDTADLHPPTMQELGNVMIEGFGGTAKVIDRAQQAFKEKKYNLTAKLLSYVLAVEPDNKGARQLKADALRAMAQTTKSGVQTRNFMLAHALHLEGKIDLTKPPKISFFGEPTADKMMATPPGSNLKLLEVNIDPEKSANVEKTVKITFTDLKRSWVLHVRRGVAEVTEQVPQTVDVTVEMPRLIFAQIITGETTMPAAIEAGKVNVKGSREALNAVIDSFDKVSKEKPDARPSGY